MAKKKEKKVNVSGKPKHSLDVNRSNGGDTKGIRTAATVRRIKMYNTRPKRDRKGKILKHELQSKELPSTRIEPDRRWFAQKAMLKRNFGTWAARIVWIHSAGPAMQCISAPQDPD